jgi:hypothetical protein
MNDLIAIINEAINKNNIYEGKWINLIDTHHNRTIVKVEETAYDEYRSVRKSKMFKVTVEEI